VKEAVVVGYLRSAFSRARPREPERDKFNSLRMDTVAAKLVDTIVERNKINPRDINEIQVASAMPVGEQWTYGGRTVVLLANMPVEVSGLFVDKQCGSSMSAMHVGALEIMAGYSDLTISCGIEHMTHNPMAGNPYIIPAADLVTEDQYKHYDMETGMVMGLTAEKLFKEAAAKYGLTKDDMDKWALRSHQMAAKAQNEGYFKDEILPIEITNPDGTKEVIDKDLAVRGDTTLEMIRGLPPAFKEGGMITAGNSSPLNAGASCIMLASKEKAKKLGLTPLATVKGLGWAGVEPSVMGKGPVPASQMALKHAGLKAKDIDFWEINEAFCIVALWAIKELGIDPEKVNVKGGATAIGHPLGASGARLTGTLARILNLEGGQYGLANACIGGGQGVATVLEREEY